MGAFGSIRILANGVGQDLTTGRFVSKEIVREVQAQGRVYALRSSRARDSAFEQGVITIVKNTGVTEREASDMLARHIIAKQNYIEGGRRGRPSNIVLGTTSFEE